MKICKTQPVSLAIFRDLLITSCSREKRYQALPAFLYCKRRKAGRGLGTRLTHPISFTSSHPHTPTHIPYPTHTSTHTPTHTSSHQHILLPTHPLPLTHPLLPTHPPTHTLFPLTHPPTHTSSYPHTLPHSHILTGEDYSEWLHHPWVPGGVDTSCQVRGYGVSSGGGAQSWQGRPTGACGLLLWKSLH